MNPLPSRVSKKKTTTANLPTIRCECGAEILLVPDVKLMGQAIEAHLQQHSTKTGNKQEAEAELERLRDDLIAQILFKAYEQTTKK